VSYPQGPRLGRVGRRSLRLNDPPPGGFAPVPHHLRESSKLRKAEEAAAERKAQRQAREYTMFTYVAMAVGFLLVVATAVLIAIAVASH
jgi:hypothetical protein